VSDTTADEEVPEPGAGTQPGSMGSGLGGPMSSGPDAGAGVGGPDDPPLLRPGDPDQSPDGPRGSQDSSLGDLDEAGD
jgi:hypothetical protein